VRVHRSAVIGREAAATDRLAYQAVADPDSKERSRFYKRTLACFGYRPSIPNISYLIVMLFSTALTPPTRRATSIALVASVWEVTEPPSRTVPLKVSTLIPLEFRPGWSRMAAITLAVMPRSS
jgi:hypothetical protein